MFISKSIVFLFIHVLFHLILNFTLVKVCLNIYLKTFLVASFVDTPASSKVTGNVAFNGFLWNQYAIFVDKYCPKGDNSETLNKY